MDGSCASKRNELKFIVDTATLTDAVVDGLGETEDVLCGGTGYGDSFVIITEEGESAHDAIRRACVKLQVNGLIVRDLQRPCDGQPDCAENGPDAPGRAPLDARYAPGRCLPVPVRPDERTLAVG